MRTQLARLTLIKVRNVFGEAFHYGLIEGLSAYPVLPVFKNLDTFYLIGKDPTFGVPAILDEISHDCRWFMVLDWSRFDALVQHWEIDVTFSCIESMVEFPTHLTRVAFEYAWTLFKKHKLIVPDGMLWMRDSEIPSESYFTNLVGSSIINYVKLRYLCLRSNLPTIRIRVQGADSLTGIGEASPPDIRFFAEIGEPLGWTVKPWKCTIFLHPNEIQFLGRSACVRYNTRYRLKALRLLCFLEFKVYNP
ncbi:hypothetical protein AMTRI_Chr02g261290 [Amborella trichopoda]